MMGQSELLAVSGGPVGTAGSRASQDCGQSQWWASQDCWQSGQSGQSGLLAVRAVGPVRTASSQGSRASQDCWQSGQSGPVRQLVVEAVRPAADRGRTYKHKTYIIPSVWPPLMAQQEPPGPRAPIKSASE